MFFGVNFNEFWMFRFLFIIVGYATISIPVILLVLYVRRKDAEGNFEPTTRFKSFLRNFAIGRSQYEIIVPESLKVTSSKNNLFDDCFCFVLCFSGLQVTLVSMGYIQERIMTQSYFSRTDHQLDKFDNTQFLVFMNRVFAIVLCAVYLCLHWKREPIHVPPYYKHSFTSFSNTLSSWCQYEALKYVSFPTQTVCKASKVLPTMLMGFIVRGEWYGRDECVCAIILALGASLFLLSNSSKGLGFDDEKIADRVTTVSGIFLMLGYLLFDAFTLNWQKTLFDTRPQVSKYQMMFGVNIFSMVLCLVTLVEQGAFLSPFHFIATHDGFAWDLFLLSLSGALGQVVIYATIERFGPVIFAIMMTLRQIFSITLSTIAYGHAMSTWSVIGLFVTFTAIFCNIYGRHRRTTQNRH